MQLMKDYCYQFLKNEVGKVDIVGFGSYGQVKLARNMQNGEVVAIKTIYNKNAKEEIDVHHKLNHPNIIKLLNYYYQKQKNVTFMVLQFASGGSLNQKIKFGYGQLSKQLVKRYFRDICEAVNYLHQKNFMHRDIKPQNILITQDNHAKLCDFGFASILQFRSTLCGTFQYMAPEMIQKKPYDYKIDIWALGILLFELIQGYAPFRGQTGEQVIIEMKKALIFSNRFEQVEIDLIKKILRVNAENRPDILKILEHAYFKDSELLQAQKQTKEQTKEIKEQFEKIRENKPFKNIKDIKEDQPKNQLKNVKIDNPEIKKKETEKKFDFFHRKTESKKEQPEIKLEKKELPKEIPKQTPKEQPKKPIQFKKQELKKQAQRKQFKPYVPPNLQNNLQNPGRHIMKSPTVKPITGNFIPVSPTAYQQNSHQFNSSLQVPPTYQPNGFPTTYQSLNPNASMSTTSTTKYINTNAPIVQPPPPNLNNFVGPSFMKPHGYIAQGRPNHQYFTNSINGNTQVPQTFQANYNWKKS